MLEWVAMPSSRDFPHPGIKLKSPALQANSLPSEPPGKPKNTGMGSLSLLQGVFLTKKLNQGLLHCRQILYQLSYQGSPRVACFWGLWEWIHSRPLSWFWWLSPILDFYMYHFSLGRDSEEVICIASVFLQHFSLNVCSFSTKTVSHIDSGPIPL